MSTKQLSIRATIAAKRFELSEATRVLSEAESAYKAALLQPGASSYAMRTAAIDAQRTVSRLADELQQIEQEFSRLEQSAIQHRAKDLQSQAAAVIGATLEHFSLERFV